MYFWLYIDVMLNQFNNSSNYDLEMILNLEIRNLIVINCFIYILN